MDNTTRSAIKFLETELDGRGKNPILSFEEFAEIFREEPQRVLRNIFQLFHDMIRDYVIKEEDEYPDDPQSIGFVNYDYSKIFNEGTNNPFFPDRLFANRFIRQAGASRRGSEQNRIYVYEGPSGCGKSTFLDNLLRAFESYTNTREGQCFEVYWDIKLEKDREIKVPCPSHDHPLLLIPKDVRAEFLNRLLSEDTTEAREFKFKLSASKEYEWLFDGEACTICKSIFWALFNLEEIKSVEKVLEMVKVRHYKFDRRLGEGISVFNPGDEVIKDIVATDRQIQAKLDKIFGANLVKYVFSQHARTNNGIYVLMDVKGANEVRFRALHNIVSEGVLKVNGTLEEITSSLFLALMNPEDRGKLEKEESARSLQGRIQYNAIPFVLDVPTEVKIYRSTFGRHIDEHFLPGVLENFARVIVASRMNVECKPLNEWIKNISKYKKYCDESGLLLRMEIYGGVIPPWLSEEDRRGLTASIRRELIKWGENEGRAGFSGREAIRHFGDFFSMYGNRSNLINMANVVNYFTKKIPKEERDDRIQDNFIGSLIRWYNYVVLNQVKEALYFYNEDQVSRNILHYLWAVNYDIGQKVKCKWTGYEFEVTLDFLKMVGIFLAGKNLDDSDTIKLALETHKEYVGSNAQEPSKVIKETDIYQKLFATYARNLKERALEPFIENNNFEEAIKSFGIKEFEVFDIRIREHVAHMIKNLVRRFGYTEQGAKEVCLYVIEKKLVEKFS